MITLVPPVSHCSSVLNQPLLSQNKSTNMQEELDHNYTKFDTYLVSKQACYYLTFKTNRTIMQEYAATSDTIKLEKKKVGKKCNLVT